MAKDLVIWHSGCLDGFAAACVFYEKYGNGFDYHPGVYGTEPPDCTDRDVYLVDFSYRREVVEKMIAVANRVVLIDHHKTAIDDLMGLEGLETFVSLHKSGCVLAWKCIHGPLKNPPLLLQHVQDRDLWQFDLPSTREICAALYSYPFDFDVWFDKSNGPWERKEDPNFYCDLVAQGAAIERTKKKEIESLIRSGRHNAMIQGHLVPALNCVPSLMSDAGNILCQDKPFSSTYLVRKDGQVQVSLRSSKTGLDVSRIAKHFGGGGHKHAAGFVIGLSEWVMIHLKDDIGGYI